MMYQLTWQKKVDNVWLSKQFIIGSIGDTHDCYLALIDSVQLGHLLSDLEIRAIITKLSPSGAAQVVAYDFGWTDDAKVPKTNLPPC